MCLEQARDISWYGKRDVLNKPAENMYIEHHKALSAPPTDPISTSPTPPIPAPSCAGQVYRHVLDLMVSITADVAAAASWACTDNAGAAAAPASKAAASTLLARRIDVGLAVSQALDATLVQLAAELRRGLGSTGTGRVTGTRRGRQQQRQLQQSPSEAIARAAAGLFFDAYEAAVAFLLRALSCLAEGDPERQEEARASLPSSSSSSSSSSPMRNRGEPLRPNQPPRGKQGSGGKQSSDETFGVRNRAPGQGTSTRQTTTTTTTTTTANTAAVCERMVERGVLPRGWDAGARRNAWAQRKLEVLGESPVRFIVVRYPATGFNKVVVLWIQKRMYLSSEWPCGRDFCDSLSLATDSVVFQFVLGVQVEHRMSARYLLTSRRGWSGRWLV